VKKEALDAYCVNLNKKAKKGKIDPLIGREAEVDRTIQVLCRRSKNNPLLSATPASARPRLRKGWRARSSKNEVPDVLKGAVIFALDMGSCWPVRAIAAISKSASRQVIKRIAEH
jgi:ATP-dependent Clp protease ATP-binding subunit ClpA